MALIRILVDGYSLLHNWPELAPGKARHSAAARDELVQILTQYHDATGMPITVFFDGSRPRSARPDGESAAAVEVLFSKAGQTADQMIERAAHRFNAYGEILAVTDDIAERDTVISLGGMASTCRNFIHELEHTLRDLHADIQHHNHKERTRFRRTSKLLVLVVLLGGALWTEGLFGQTNTAASRENRWLFVVQTSASMRPRTAAIQEIAARMLLSGMNGQMQRGDTLGVWTYNETLHTGLFPLQRWTPEASKDIARGVFEFLKAQPYEKEGGYKVISESLEQIVGDSAVLTVIWISDGRQKILYSPFDDKINAIHEAWAKQQEKANLPLLTALRAVRGRLTDYTVTVPPFAFELPPLPPELNLAEATKAKPEPVQPPPQPVPSLILSGKQPEHPPSDANSAEVAAEPATGTPKPVLPQGTTKISSEAKPVQPTRVESNAPVPSLGSDQANPSLPSPVQAADTRPQQPFLTVGKSLVIAILFAILVLGIVLGLLLRSRRSSRISLITRSLDREQK